MTDLVLVVSAARSGTNALGSMLRAGFPRAMWGGEVYGGYAPPGIRGRLVREFSWYAERSNAGYAERMNASAVDVSRAAVGQGGRAVVVKVFPWHLSTAAFDAVLGELRPRIVVLRRVLLFSLLSLQKSTTSGRWLSEDSTDVPVTLDDATVAAYVARNDAWFDLADDRIDSLGLDACWLTYSDLHESRAGLPLLREFFASTGDGPVPDEESWFPRTAIQDRRTDESLVRTLQQVFGLAAENRQALLRLPGRRP